MTTMASITIQTAPRNVDDLAQIGRFQLRRLADQLGLCADEPSKQAFMGMSSPTQAQAVLAKLLEHDKGGANGTPANGAVHAPAQAQAPAAPQTPPAQAAPETAAPAAAPRRQPKTVSDPGTGGDAAAQVVESLQGVASQLGALIQKFDQVAKSSDAAGASSEQVKGQVNALIAELGKLNPYLQNLSEAMKGVVQMQCVVTTLNLMLAEQVLGAPRDEVLQAAIADAPGVQKLLQATQGK